MDFSRINSIEIVKQKDSSEVEFDKAEKLLSNKDYINARTQYLQVMTDLGMIECPLREQIKSRLVELDLLENKVMEAINRLYTFSLQKERDLDRLDIYETILTIFGKSDLPSFGTVETVFQNLIMYYCKERLYPEAYTQCTQKCKLGIHLNNTMLHIIALLTLYLEYPLADVDIPEFQHSLKDGRLIYITSRQYDKIPKPASYHEGKVIEALLKKLEPVCAEPGVSKMTSEKA